MAPRLGKTRTRGLRASVAVCAFGLLSGCSADLDPLQATICRVAAVAVFDPLPLKVADEAPLAAGDGSAAGVTIRLQSPQDGTLHHIDCRFEGLGGGEPDLVEIRTEAGVLSGSRLVVLKRFWLGTPEARAADPALVERGAGLPSLPFVLAYPLQSLLAALPNAAIYGLLASTYSLVYGLFGRINLAFGEVAAVGGFAALLGAAATARLPVGLALLTAGAFAVWAAAVHGAAIERWVMWPMRRSTGQQGLVATIGLALALQEYLRLASGNHPRYIPSILSGAVSLVRAGDFIVTVTPLALLVFAGALAASFGVLALLRFTGFGRDWRAMSDDPVAASICGVDPRRLSLKTFMLACGLAGLAGAAATLISGSVGLVYTTTLGLKALIAAIIGGIGSVSGAFLGGLAIAIIEAAWSAYLPIADRDLVIDSLLVAMLVFRPGGLFGYRDLLPRRI